MIAVLEKLAAAGIQILLAEMTTHFVLERSGYAALVERKDDGFGGVGAPGLLTDRGLAVLVWRGGEPFFVSKGYDQAAEAGQVSELRAFMDDLKRALGGQIS